MRQITKEAVNAFINGEKFSKDNTRVFWEKELGQFELTEMFLHGNLIAKKHNTNRSVILTISSCGWKTNTTKERLNGILEAFNLGQIKQIKGKWYLMVDSGNKIEFKDGMTFKWIILQKN